MHSIVNRVRPAVEGLLETGLKNDYDALCITRFARTCGRLQISSATARRSLSS